jgi:mannose-6-phosphate isomerase-like protein (cupin superfamily)
MTAGGCNRARDETWFSRSPEGTPGAPLTTSPSKSRRAAGPLLHVHHKQEETIHVLKGRFKVRIGDEVFQLDEGGFAYLPSTVPHTFLNLTDAPGELIVVYTPGGGHKFYEALGPATRNGTPDRAVVAAIFEKHDMSLLGPPLSAD